MGHCKKVLNLVDGRLVTLHSLTQIGGLKNEQRTTARIERILKKLESSHQD